MSIRLKIRCALPLVIRHYALAGHVQNNQAIYGLAVYTSFKAVSRPLVTSSNTVRRNSAVLTLAHAQARVSPVNITASMRHKIRRDGIEADHMRAHYVYSKLRGPANVP